MQFFERFRHVQVDGVQAVASRPHVALAAPESRARRLVLWALATWTGLSALCLILAQGDFSTMLASGLKDRAGQRLLGVQLLALMALYGYAALHTDTRGLHTWLPLGVESLTALVILYDTVAGHRGFGSAWPALVIALFFTLLLAGFLLAGEPAFTPHRELTALHRFDDSAPLEEDTRTQRLTRPLRRELDGQPTEPQPAKQPSSDDPVLGA